MKILAKSEPQLTLDEHIEDCLKIWQQLPLLFPNAQNKEGFEHFWELLRLSVVFHDLGKGHQEFQKVLRGEANQWNGQRHELFSIPFIEAIKIDEEKKDLVRLVVAGHHKDFRTLYQNYIEKAYQTEGEEDFGMLPSLDNDDNSFVGEFVKNVNIESIFMILRKYNVNLDQVEADEVDKLVLRYLNKPYTQDYQNYWLLLLLFAGLKHCDHLGSARVMHIPKIEIKNFLFLDKLKDDLKQKGKDYYQHQKDCAVVNGNLILTAPTGSGKTESALLWLRNQLIVNGQGRVFYILPFTASINAMYERLGKDFDSDQSKNVGMLHGKLSAYLSNYFEDYQYSVSERKEKIKELREKFKNILTPIKVVTPFQLLKNLFGLKGFEQGIFEWIGSYLIFDEIHAYSPEVFAQIKVLLEFTQQNLNSKVMIMTATLPTFLKQEIQEAIGNHEEVQASEELYSNFRRHQVIIKEGLLSENFELIESDLSQGKKVLIVSNTVKQSQEAFEYFRDEFPKIKKVLLHGSFNGVDRNRKEQDLLKGENKNEPSPEIQLLLGTQAIEVSLDIDYDVIYTEPAPIDALIQRFGRINRRREKGICPCYVFKESNESDFYIYAKDATKKTIEIFEKNEKENNGVVEEILLQKFIDFVYPDWDEKGKAEFEMKYKYLKDSLHDLSPLLHSKHKEEDFYKQFDGIKILPQSQKKQFEKYLNELDFINAENLKVQIRKGKFAWWIDEGYIRKNSFVLSKNSKLLQIDFFETNKVYEPELGLFSDEVEPWHDTLIL